MQGPKARWDCIASSIAKKDWNGVQKNTWLYVSKNLEVCGNVYCMLEAGKGAGDRMADSNLQICLKNKGNTKDYHCIKEPSLWQSNSHQLPVDMQLPNEMAQ